ncbi:MAG: glycogen/starch/alpha-glucan phosphorylase [Betaproteobacteria bacterium]|nr:glycogen/starch/alpha-glucan phosphorylase [Betaproteobacteria bacterium]
MKSDPKSIVFNYQKLEFDVPTLQHSLANRLTYTIGKDPITATGHDWFHALAYVVRDRLAERWMETMRSFYRNDAKRIYYFSMEFLTGRMLVNSLSNLGFYQECRDLLDELGLDLNELCESEPDPALGNGGLGRLAACFLDSMATLGLHGYGYGIRYEYGMFNQRIQNGEQVEHPDNWLRYGNPWEFPRPEVIYPVKYFGRVIEYVDNEGHNRHLWVDGEEIMAMAFDTPVPGYKNEVVNNLRLWTAKATRDFELRYFNEGNYIKSVEDKNESENLSKVLYPDDTTLVGRELRLKQQHFFVSASLQDILHRFQRYHSSFDDFPEKVAIQLNDTHPSIAIPELMRLLMDVHYVEWDKSWDITRRVFSYTNHTLMSEALETWPVSLFERILPRHLQIIFEINHRFLKDVMHRYPGDSDVLQRMSIIGEEGQRHIRMAHLAIVGSHRVNGVSSIHTELMKRSIFLDFDRFFPGRIINITNGVTPRLWLKQANPHLSDLISSCIGKGWVGDLSQLHQLAPLAEDAGFRKKFMAVKHSNKIRLAGLIKSRLGLEVDPDSLFDVQIKRIHEYKRQLLNVLHIVTRYNRIRNNNVKLTPRTVIFGGKAAPGYVMAKRIIRLINDIADIVNNDPVVNQQLKVVFIPNYDVSTALDIIPAADLSEQISTAGTEASGTGNMKLAMNGALTIGTLDGANIEILEAVGEDNIFIFGLDAARAKQCSQNYQPMDVYNANAELKAVLDMISSGFFSPDEPHRYRSIVDSLLQHGDAYLLLADYASYINAQDIVDRHFEDSDSWARKAILNVAYMGGFSSDRTVTQYAKEIWRLEG